ncbi:MAG: SNF2-related protein, partial [Microcoleaceae cyanobacterium]
MAILHGIWLINPLDPLDSSLFIWAENWRKINEDEQGNTDEIKVYPYSLNIDELLHLSEISKRLDLAKENLAVLATTKTISLPVIFQVDTEKLLPIHSSTNIEQLSLPSPDQSPSISKQNIGLYPWQIAGISLPINMAIIFLESLPLGNINDDLSFIGSDLKFWSHINRWGLDLLARCKFLPILSLVKEDNFLCEWATLLDSGIDQNRLQRFAEKMPFACRTYQLENQPDNTDYINNIILTSPRLILENFLS